MQLFDRLLAADPRARGEAADGLPYLGALWVPRSESPALVAQARRRYQSLPDGALPALFALSEDDSTSSDPSSAASDAAFSS